MLHRIKAPSDPFSVISGW